MTNFDHWKYFEQIKNQECEKSLLLKVEDDNIDYLITEDNYNRISFKDKKVYYTITLMVKIY